MQEYLRSRERFDDLMREGFFKLAKAKCEKSTSPMRTLPGVPTRHLPNRRIVSALSWTYVYFDAFLSTLSCKRAVRDYEPVESADQRVEHSSGVDTPPDEIKDFIQELALKYDCVIDGDTSQSTMSIHSDERLKLSGAWNECQEIFSIILEEIEKVVQIIYKINISIQRQKKTPQL